MKKWTKLAALLTVGTVLAACGNETEESAEAPETAQEKTTEISTETPAESTGSETEYQDMLDQAQAQFDADQTDEAAGTLSILLKNDLSSFPELQSEAENLLEEVNVAQAEKARQAAGASSDKTEYQTERQSSVLSEEYLADTGESIEEATDEELGNWLTQREAEVKENEEKAEEETTPGSQFATDAEAEDYAFEQVMNRLELTNENYSYFVDKTDEEWVTVEVRETVEQDGVEWSNMIGLYRFNLNDEHIEKLDSVTGEYQTVE